MPVDSSFITGLRNGFMPELEGADQTLRRSVISERRLDAIGDKSLFSEFIRLASKQGKNVCSSIWGLEENRESRLRHLYLSGKLEKRGLFIRVDILDGDELSGESRWYIRNAAFLESLPGVRCPSEKLLTEIYICNFLYDKGFDVKGEMTEAGRFSFLALCGNSGFCVSAGPGYTAVIESENGENISAPISEMNRYI